MPKCDFNKVVIFPQRSSIIDACQGLVYICVTYEKPVIFQEATICVFVTMTTETLKRAIALGCQKF